jgi:hypothetical protein
MKNYLVVYYGRVKPTFLYASTVEEARSYALMVLTSQYSRSNDVLSIIEVSTDAVVDYGKRDDLLDKYNLMDKQVAVSGSERSNWSFSLKPVLNWISLKLAKPTVG